MALGISEVIMIIGKRQKQSTYDVIAIIPDTTKKKLTNGAILFSVPTTDTTKATDVKGIPLKKIDRFFTVEGILIDGDDGLSKLNMTTTNFDTDGTISGGTAITSILKKEWALFEMAQSIAEPHTVQIRGTIIPTANPQTTPPTEPSDETKNIFHKMCTVTDMEITDKAEVAQSPQTAFSRYMPRKLGVKITFKWGPYTR